MDATESLAIWNEEKLKEAFTFLLYHVQNRLKKLGIYSKKQDEFWKIKGSFVQTKGAFYMKPMFIKHQSGSRQIESIVWNVTLELVYETINLVFF